MTDLSVIIPCRNEEYLPKTVEDILKNRRAETEAILVLDGWLPDPPLKLVDGVRFLHFQEPIGQRAATNEGVKASSAKFVMKADAHCAFDTGFDVKLMEGCEKDWTVVPRMFNLHVFDWKCMKCQKRFYQRPRPETCPSCKHTDLRMRNVWKPRRGTQTDQMRFDSTLQFQYWKSRRPQGDLIESMSFIGACWMVHRDRYWEMEGLDEGHGFWGQVGTEIACKTWLSGGKLIVNRGTWFAHMFRTQFGWPYHITQGMVNRAREYSRDLWFNNRWHKQVHTLRWLVEKFNPVPGWEGFQWKENGDGMPVRS